MRAKVCYLFSALGRYDPETTLATLDAASPEGAERARDHVIRDAFAELRLGLTPRAPV